MKGMGIYYTASKEATLKKGEVLCCIIKATKKTIQRVIENARWIQDGLPKKPLFAVIPESLYKEINDKIIEILVILHSEVIAKYNGKKEELEEIALESREVLKITESEILAIINKEKFQGLCIKYWKKRGLRS